MKPSTVCISFSPATTITKINKTRGSCADSMIPIVTRVGQLSKVRRQEMGDELLVRLLARAALWDRIQTSLKIHKMSDISKGAANTL